MICAIILWLLTPLFSLPPSLPPSLSLPLTVRSSFKSLTAQGPEAGVLVVMFDKNPMEAGGYAAALADITGENIYLAESFLTDPDPPLRWDDLKCLTVRDPASGTWLKVRAALRYVTQKPWTRLPLVSTTPLLNPLLPCLAGGRNKNIAARAYADLNAKLPVEAPKLRTPATISDVSKPDIPHLIRSMGGCAVVKVPYGNAGQGVYTITNQSELDSFLEETHKYDKFIVQQLVGGREWGGHITSAATTTNTLRPAVVGVVGGGKPPPHHASSSSVSQPLLSSPQSPPSPTTSTTSTAAIPSFERMYHLGTVPDKRGDVFVYDMRMMVCADENGYAPVAVYARKALEPLGRFAPPVIIGGPLNPSWLQLGTNLSRLTDDLT